MTKDMLPILSWTTYATFSAGARNVESKRYNYTTPAHSTVADDSVNAMRRAKSILMVPKLILEVWIKR
jgi:hypothetical protein